MIKNIFLGFSAGILLLGLSAAVFADENENIDNLLFMEIPSVVTASKQEQSINDAPAVLTVITKEEIRKFGANNLHDILNRSVSITTMGGTLLVDGMTSMRGDLFSQDLHVLPLLNGRPLRESMGGYNMALYEGFPIEAIERIEIIRGPGSVLYGSNAYVGVINIITEPSSNETDLSLIKANAGGGSIGTAFGGISADLKKGELTVKTAAKYFNSTGWAFKAIDMNDISGSRDYGKNNYSLNALVNYKNLSINFLGVRLKDAVMADIPQWPIAPMDAQEDRVFLDVGYKHDFSSIWRANFNATFNYHYFIITNTAQSNYKSFDYLGEATLFGALSEKLNLVFGGVFDKRTHPEQGDLIGSGDLRSYPIKMADQNNISTYFQFNYTMLDFLTTTAGIQYNQPYRGYPGVVSRLGLVSNPKKALGVKLLYAEAFRSSWPIETDVNTVALMGNPELKPEKIATTDLQIFYTKKNYQGTLTYFYSKYYDTIMMVGQPMPLPSTYMNGSGLTAQGVELEGKAALRNDLELTGSYTYQTNKSDSGLQDYMLTPNHLAKLGIMYDLNSKISFGLFDSFYSKPPDVSNVAPLRMLVNPVPEAYNWLTLNIIYKATERVELSLYGTNILDQSVYYPEFCMTSLNSIPGLPGFAAYFKATIKL